MKNTCENPASQIVVQHLEDLQSGAIAQSSRDVQVSDQHDNVAFLQF